MRVFITRFLRLGAMALLLMFGAAAARADDALRHVQESLRDQGFYYGPINGSPGDETTQALRRYQIRNGLAVTGQLNDETRRSIERTGAAGTPPPLGTPSSASNRRVAPTYAPTPTPAPAYRPPPPPRAQPPDADEPDDAAPVAPRGPGNIRPDLRVGPGSAPSVDGYAVPPGGIMPSATLSALFASTPYEFAPPPVQADVLRRVQVYLGRNGFYDGRADGVPGPSTTEALTNFQEVSRLRRSGRLDVSTLGTMRLLPGRQTVGPRRDGDPRQGPNIIFPGRGAD